MTNSLQLGFEHTLSPVHILHVRTIFQSYDLLTTGNRSQVYKISDILKAQSSSRIIVQQSDVSCVVRREKKFPQEARTTARRQSDESQKSRKIPVKKRKFTLRPPNDERDFTKL